MSCCFTDISRKRHYKNSPRIQSWGTCTTENIFQWLICTILAWRYCRLSLPIYKKYYNGNSWGNNYRINSKKNESLHWYLINILEIILFFFFKWKLLFLILGIFNQHLLKKFPQNDQGMTEVNDILLQTSEWISQRIQKARQRLFQTAQQRDPQGNRRNQRM